MKQYGIMVIGCGHIGKEHLSGIYYYDHVNIVAVVDKNYERALMASKKYCAKFHATDYKEFLQRQDIDIVIIATYADSHLSILKDCLAAGKHVLCEKPIATTKEDGESFYRAVKESSCKVLIGHILRHNNSYIKLRELIRSGVIGDLKVIRMVQNHHAMNWERYIKLLEDASPILDCGVHYIDIIEWLTGASITEVAGIGNKIDEDSPTDNFGLVTMKMDNGCVGYYESGWSPKLSSQNIKEFIGTKGRISLELQAQRTANREEGDLITVYHSDTKVYETMNIESKYKDMKKQLSVLIDMIENDGKAEPNIDEVYKAFKIAIFAQEAIR